MPSCSGKISDFSFIINPEPVRTTSRFTQLKGQFPLSAIVAAYDRRRCIVQHPGISMLKHNLRMKRRNTSCDILKRPGQDLEVVRVDIGVR